MVAKMKEEFSKGIASVIGVVSIYLLYLFFNKIFGFSNVISWLICFALFIIIGVVMKRLAKRDNNNGVE